MLKHLQIVALGAIAVTGAACATGRSVPPAPLPPSTPPGASMIGVASWYGPGFDGRRTSSGEIYNQESLTAASVVFPIGTQLRVTNLNNGRQVEVTVNDHGPYLKGRGLDLSHKAAQRLGMIGPGTARVRMDVLRTPPGGPAKGLRYYVRVASFFDPARARALQGQLASRFPDVELAEVEIDGAPHYRVQMGAFTDRNEAWERATNLAKLGYSPLVVTE
jgi:rare lipoprotein A